MSRLFQGLIPHVKKFALYMGFNTEVATKNWPTRGTYRIAPASAPAPTFTHNFPLKQDQITDLHFVDRATRLNRESMNVPVILNHSSPRRDVRNIWSALNRRHSVSLPNSTGKADHALPRFGQVSEAHEASL